MRRISHRDEPEHGLKVALKALAVVIAVGLLAMVAGQSAYTMSGAGSQAAPKYQLIEPAPEDAPYVAGDTPANGGVDSDRAHLMASGPKTDQAPDRQGQ